MMIVSKNDIEGSKEEVLDPQYDCREEAQVETHWLKGEKQEGPVYGAEYRP